MPIFQRGGGDQSTNKNGTARRKTRRDPDSDDESESSQDDYDDEEEQMDEKKSKTTVRYRQWLYDRVDGVRRPSEGKYDKPDPYPPHSLCLPPTILRLCPFLLEENSLCVTIGQKGCCAADEAWARSAVMRYSLFLNLMGILLMGCVSISLTIEDFTLLKYASLGQAELTPTPENLFDSPIKLYMGLRGVAFDNPNIGVQQIVPYDEFCNLVDQPPAADATTDTFANTLTTNDVGFSVGLSQYLEQPAYANCGECEDAMPIMVIGLLAAMVFVIPSMGINCARMYLATDLNCQKVWGLFVGLFSLAGCGLVFYFYTYVCQGSFLQGETGFSRTGAPVEVDSVAEVVRVTFDWGIGYGMICLFAAIALKILDIVCNCCIPTPIITRNNYEQKLYETKALKARAALEEDSDDNDDDYSDE